MYGFYRVASAIHKTTVANPKANAKEVISLLKEANNQNVGVVVFPELTLTSYSASDLFFQHKLYSSQNIALERILEASKEIDTIAIIGVAVIYQNRLYNCGAVILLGEILGIIPKSFIPNSKEFYEKRHFNSGANIKNRQVDFISKNIPFGVDLLFKFKDILFGVEICEDLWAVTPPSNTLISSGANVIFNLSASNEVIGKAEYREDLVRMQSAKGMCAYVYSSCGVGESTTDMVFGGDGIICEYGSVLAKSKRFTLNNQLITADIDIQKLIYLRLSEGGFGDFEPVDTRVINISKMAEIDRLNRYINPTPFIPSNDKEKQKRCEEIVNIQAHGLIKRLTSSGISKVVIGISGGLDSTLALLSTYRAFEIMEWDKKDIIAITMGGFGTTSRTKNSATSLCEALGVTFKDIDIVELSLKEFEAIGHSIDDLSVTYENVQARARTAILMNLANKSGGLVVGTGDLSEMALGWSTYNGDHISMYGLNATIPKTLIKYVIEYFKENREISNILDNILNTPISPELLPHDDDKIIQETEAIIGAYQLHDFFLYHFIKYGAEPKKIEFLANIAFKDVYKKDEIKKVLKTFLNRFFTQQFKRSCTPDAPKVGTISLSPRADWRMASDTSRDEWLDWD
jgi:NAD+ synthase (glutamine-hydrolysing)